jgi:cobalt-precorrin-5B (C1)-methyltransferase
VPERKPLRSGYTTGACAAAAAKAGAALLLGRGAEGRVAITLPGGQEAAFRLKEASLGDGTAYASVIKDAGDDPDITHGAEIGARVERIHEGRALVIRGGQGVGLVTRPGLPVAVGEPAINPVPRRMIREAVQDVLGGATGAEALKVTIIVPEGERLAEKTLNRRLGIVGGISILGTTGIVTPMSTAAWRATITSSMDVARAMGLSEAVLSAGRTSERAHMKAYALPEASYVLMGDYVEFSLREAARHRFERVSLVAQWAKMLKTAMGTPDTHVRAGPIRLEEAAAFLRGLGAPLPHRQYNTAREMFELLAREGGQEVFGRVCSEAAAYGWRVSGLPVRAHLVSYGGDIIVLRAFNN